MTIRDTLNNDMMMIDILIPIYHSIVQNMDNKPTCDID